MPCLLNHIVVVSQGTAILVHSYAHVVKEVEGVVGELRFGREQMSQGAAGQVGESCQEHDKKWLGMGVSQEVHAFRHLLELHQDDERGQQVCPHIDRLVVPLEESQEVVAPALVGRPVACDDVGLLEHPGHVVDSHSAGQLGEGRLQQLGDLTKLLDVDEQAADLLHHYCRHGERKSGIYSTFKNKKHEQSLYHCV